MIDIINQFGGKKDVFLLLMFIVLLFLLSSSIKSNKARIFFSSLASLFVCTQAFSLYFTQSFIGYQFYIHANLRGVIGMHHLFITQMIIAFLMFIFILIINYYSYNLFRKLNQLLKYPQKQFLVKIIKRCCVISLLFIVIIVGDFVKDTKTLLPILVSNDLTNFKDVLAKYNMSDYITPDEIECTAGNNIIVISMESLERAFLNDRYASLTPNLNILIKKWKYFDMKANAGSGWTSGSLYTYLTGFPALFGVHGNSIFQAAYHSNISGISHALKKANYETIYLNGNTDHFGIKEILDLFQFDKIIDYKNVGKTGHESTFGIRDKDLFSLAKNEIIGLKSSNKRFALFISTTDTHFPGGIYDERMESVIPRKNSNLEFMVASLDYLIGDFISFLQKNMIMENTTIYLFPDHLKMGDPSIFKDLGERGLYLITNSGMIKESNETIYQIDLPKIILNGSNIKHNLKFLTDYIPKEKGAYINNNILTITEINTNGILNPSIEAFNPDNVSKNFVNYKNDTSRYIAHAGGKIEGKVYTNSLEALNLSYQKGFRLFELDIIQTIDGEFVAAHDWKHWSKITNYSGSIPVSREQFLKIKLFGKYTPLDMDAINSWFYEHKDAILVTDKVNDPIKFSGCFIDKNRLMMELFDEQSVNDGIKAGILSAMPSQSLISNLSRSDVKELAQKGIKNIAISRSFISNNKDLLLEFKKYNIKVFAYHVNVEPGIDEAYVTKYEMDYIYGIYADVWGFK